MASLAHIAGATALAAAASSAALIVALLPLMRRYALARPNARSSHTVPTPQGGGIPVILATLGCALAALAFVSGAHLQATAIAAIISLALIGALDDISPIAVLPRLALQAMCVAAALWSLPALDILPGLPDWTERALLFFGLMWFVNLTNFMDGIDLITVAETVPIAATIVLLGWLGHVGAATTLLAAALAGATIGFAPFNRPVAKVFLGDVGSLPIGFLLGWCLIDLAQTSLCAAILLPLYYLADATITLARRIWRRERVWQAHRSHFYQRATDNGFSVIEIVSRVAGLNVALAIFAVACTTWPSMALHVASLTIGAVATGLLLAAFARRRH